MLVSVHEAYGDGLTTLQHCECQLAFLPIARQYSTSTAQRGTAAEVDFV